MMRLRRYSLIATLVVTFIAAHLSPSDAAPKTNASDFAGFEVVPQFGSPYGARAIVIAPNGKWFATGREIGIDLWDMETDTILRGLAAPAKLASLAISADGRLVLARDQTNKVWAWIAETGREETVAKTAVPTEDQWNPIGYAYDDPARNWGPDFLEGTAARSYLAEKKLDSLVHPGKFVRIERSNHRNIIEVTFQSGDDEATGGVRYAFLDIVQKTMVLEFTSQLTGGSCGNAAGVFAMDAHHLVLVPTDSDASADFTAAAVWDVTSAPWKPLWSHKCQDFRDASIFLQDDFLVSGAFPNDLTIWDIKTMKRVATFTGEPIGQHLAISADRRLIAYIGPGKNLLGEMDGTLQGLKWSRDGIEHFVVFPEKMPGTSPIVDVRVSPSGKQVFALNGKQWLAWDAVTARSIVGTIVPPAPSDDEASPQPLTVTSKDGRLVIRSCQKNCEKGVRSRLEEVGTSRAIIVADSDLHFTNNFSQVWARTSGREQSITVWTAASGKPVWTASDLDSEFLILRYANGKIALSPGAEQHIKLVRGFEVRPFDADAKKYFLKR